MMLVERPGYRIHSRTIKRGSRPSILIVSFVKSSNLCILAIIFIGSFLALIMVWSWCLSCSSWQSQVHQKHISYASSLAFSGFGDFVGSSLWKVSLFHLLEKSPLLVCNIFTFCRVALVVLFPTKLDSPRSEFPCESYSVSGFCSFSLSGGSTAVAAVVPLLLEWDY